MSQTRGKALKSPGPVSETSRTKAAGMPVGSIHAKGNYLPPAAMPSHAQWLPPAMVAKAHEIYTFYATGSPNGELNLAALQKLLEDMGVTASDNVVRDLMLQVSQPQSATSIDKLTLPFPLVLHLLTLPLNTATGADGSVPSLASSSNAHALVTADYQTIWKQLDVDKDGALGAKDIAQSYQKFAPEHMQHLSAEQIEALLHELDEDGDGKVSFGDFASAVSTH